MSLEKSFAFVSGGSSGLGKSICMALAEEGSNVAVGYRNGLDRAEEVCHTIEGLGRSAIAVQMELDDPTSIENAINETASKFDGLDILINNAAMALGGHTVAPGDLEAFTPEIWDEMMNINVRGPFLAARAAANYLRASGSGSIVNIGSTLGAGEWYADRAFAPSKAAIVPLTKFLASSLAPDVSVNCVAPGLMVETGLGGGGGPYVDVWKNRSVLNSTTSISDVTGQVVYLCKTKTITGQSIIIDAGVHYH